MINEAKLHRAIITALKKDMKKLDLIRAHAWSPNADISAAVFITRAEVFLEVLSMIAEADDTAE